MGTIIITGANGSLGLAVVNRLLKEGNQVLAVTGRAGAGKPPDHANLLTREVDLSNESEAQKFVESSVQNYSDLRAAILLVGGFAMGKLEDTDRAGLQKMIELNFFTAYNVVRPLLKQFLNHPGGGQFILIGSRPGLNADAGLDFFAYSLSKAMIFKLAEFINAEGKDKGVTATVIVPSTIDTDANRKAMPGADFSRWVPAENIADAISYALSETGRMMRESVIKIYHKS